MHAKYQQDSEHEDAISRATSYAPGPRFGPELNHFVEKYITDHRLKSSTAKLLRQREARLVSRLGDLPLTLIDTRAIRRAIENCSQFEQSKVKSLLSKFFQYAISEGSYPSRYPNPISHLYIDPQPPKRRQRITTEQFRAIYRISPEWMQWLLTLSVHLALRRVDLVNLRFEDIADDRIVSCIRKTDTDARSIESTSVDFPIHPDVRRVLAHARESSLANGRCPFVVHRSPTRMTQRLVQALEAGTLEHPAQISPQYASKAFNNARAMAATNSALFEGMSVRDMPTLHEVRSLPSHLYALAGYDLGAVRNSWRIQIRT